MDRPVGGRQLDLDSPDQPWARRRFNLPCHQRDGQRRRAAHVDEADIGTRCDGISHGRIQVAIGGGRPQPDRILGHLAIGLLVQNPTADVPSALRLEQADAGGVRGVGDDAGRLDQSWLDHA